MKKIIILVVAFLGIYEGFTQLPAAAIVTDSVVKTVKKMAPDSLAVKETAKVKLFPNPAKNKAELEVTGFEPGIIKLQIIDISGNKLRDDERLLVSGNENITLMFSLQAGIYFIVIRQKDKLVKKKLVIQ
ncbi:T9SS type A sorting domain-containing protein [Ferruginibacter sp.]